MNMHQSPGIAMIETVALALGDLREQMVFVGGSILGLLITDQAAPLPRPTDDVDVLTVTTTLRDHAALEEKLRALGFRHVQDPGAPACRFQVSGVTVDVVASGEHGLAYKDKWSRTAFETADTLSLPSGVRIRVANAALFVAMKIEAFGDRGNRDFMASRDIEDVISVVSGRPGLLEEIASADSKAREYIASEVAALLEDDRFQDAVPGHLAEDELQVPTVFERLRQIARLSNRPDDGSAGG